jgi:hypothetical protein
MMVLGKTAARPSVAVGVTPAGSGGAIGAVGVAGRTVGGAFTVDVGGALGAGPADGAPLAQAASAIAKTISNP